MLLRHSKITINDLRSVELSLELAVLGTLSGELPFSAPDGLIG
jgi:hypothetical protein